jgi:tetratricopeptide (TPR) repeat protein
MPLLEGRLTVQQHREVLTLAGYLALLIGCVEYDMGLKTAAEATRKAALSLGQEAGHGEVVAWAHEMAAWYTLTQGDYRGTVAASKAGQAAAGEHGVAVQLAAQRAKAWARLGDRRQLEVALDEGRQLLEALPHPDNIDHHFVVDPAKFDFYAMDCYRRAGEDRLAENHARQVLAAGTDFDGVERSPMRNAEARVTLGVVAARQGDVEAAVTFGQQALSGNRHSLPSLLLASRELAHILRTRFADSPHTATYLDQLAVLSSSAQ